MAIGAEALAGRDAAALERNLDAADRAFNEQRWDEALAGYTAIIDEIPAFSQLLVQIGNTHRAKGDYEAGAGCLRTPAGRRAEPRGGQSRSRAHAPGDGRPRRGGGA